MKSKIYYLAFAITFCMCLISFAKKLPIVGFSAFALSCYFLLAEFLTKTMKAMAKATIQYDLSDNDDRMEYDRANKSLDMSMFIWDAVYNMKKEFERILESNQNTTQAEFDLLDKVFERIHEGLDEHGIRIDELIN